MKIRTKHLIRRAGVVGGATAASLALVAGSATAAGSNVSGDKTLGADSIDCGGTVPVTVTLDAKADIVENPADIMLVLDRSGSMSGTPLSQLKTAANQFVEIIDESTDGEDDDDFNGSRMGVVSFANNATLDQPLTGGAAGVKTAINNLTADGLTNHEDAISTAQAELAGSSSNQFMVIFTDGKTTVGGDGQSEAAAARADGTEIYAIGFTSSGTVDESQLEGWATDPDDEHVFIAPDAAELQAAFEEIGADIVQPGATNVQVVDTVDDKFSIQNEDVDKGTVTVSDNTITWEIDELFTETVNLTFDAVHDQDVGGGTLAVNPTVTYTDDQNNEVTFPNPTVDVGACDIAVDVKPGSCPNPLDLTKHGVLPAAIVGAADFDVNTVDPDSVRLEGVEPLRWNTEDVATPFTGELSDPPARDDCTADKKDGFTDLTLKFDAQDVLAAIAPVAPGDVVVVSLTANLLPEFGGGTLEGKDVVWIRK